MVSLRTARLNIKQDRQCMYKIMLKFIHLSFLAVEKQHVLHVMSECLYSCFNCISCRLHSFCAELCCHIWPVSL
jgi:hypothetical protein